MKLYNFNRSYMNPLYGRRPKSVAAPAEAEDAKKSGAEPRQIAGSDSLGEDVTNYRLVACFLGNNLTSDLQVYLAHKKLPPP